MVVATTFVRRRMKSFFGAVATMVTDWRLIKELVLVKP